MARVPISVRLSDAEYSTIARRADLDGYLPSVYIRIAALTAASCAYPDRDVRRDALAVAVVRAIDELARLRDRCGAANCSAVAGELLNLRGALIEVGEGKTS